jgi:DNA primase
VHALLADAAAHYRGALLTSPEALSRLGQRGIGSSIAEHFGLGYARQKWRDLFDVFARHDDATVFASGLAVVKNQPYEALCCDRFRGQLMFPIRDRHGAVAGFGGCVLEGPDSKYLHSIGGSTLQKPGMLYGLYEAQASIGEQGLAVVVEDYLDVVTLAQAGFSAVVGSLGAACSREQISELLLLSNRLVFCFDGDESGCRAANKAMLAVLPFVTDDRDIAFMFLPKNHNLNSFIRQNGIDGFYTALARCIPMVEFLAKIHGSGLSIAAA